jgi:hypothetical protein
MCTILRWRSAGQSLLAAAFLFLFAATAARADMIVSVQSVSAFSGSSGNTLDVTLTNSGPGDVTIGGFSFIITAGDAGIDFTMATTGTTLAPYIFAGHSLFGPEIDTSHGQTLAASDAYDVAQMGATVGAGATVGLGHVFFDVASSEPAGPVSVTFDTEGTSLSDPNGGNIPIDRFNDGTITVINGQGPPVPEPSTFVLGAIGAVLLAWKRRQSMRVLFGA